MLGENILLTKTGIVKIADFGLARYIDKLQIRPLTQVVVTLWYRPPEILLGDRKYDYKCDMWSAGIIMLEMLLRRCPFMGKNEKHQLEEIFKLCGTPNEGSWSGIQKYLNYYSNK